MCHENCMEKTILCVLNCHLYQYSLLSATLRKCGVPNFNKSFKVNKWHYCGGGLVSTKPQVCTYRRNLATLMDKSWCDRPKCLRACMPIVASLMPHKILALGFDFQWWGGGLAKCRKYLLWNIGSNILFTCKFCRIITYSIWCSGCVKLNSINYVLVTTYALSIVLILSYNGFY